MTVPVEIHQPDFEESTDSGEENEVPEAPDFDSSDGQTLWYLSGDACKGTPVT